jgi:hypothetical protein
MNPFFDFLARGAGSLFPVVLAALAVAAGATFSLLVPYLGQAVTRSPLAVPAVEVEATRGPQPRKETPRGKGKARPALHGARRHPVKVVLTGLLAGIVAVLVLNAAERHLPPTDAAAFRQRNSVVIERRAGDGAGEVRNTVRLAFPQAVRVDDDFAVSVAGSLQRVADETVVGDSGLALLGGSEGSEIVAGRTLRRHGPALTFERSWQITPRREGRRLFTFAYGGTDLTPAAPPAPPASFRDQTDVSYGASTATLAPPRLDASFVSGLEVALSDDRAGGPSTIRFPVLVTTSLGVSKSTYELVKVVAAILSFLASSSLVAQALGLKGGDD